MCKLNTCVCECPNCQTAKGIVLKSGPCKTCGACPTCGRSNYAVPQLQYVPYLGGWYCITCMIVHPYNYVCIRYNQPATPWVTTTLPVTWIPNTIYNPTTILGNDWQWNTGSGFTINCDLTPPESSDANGNSNS
jgi:hypothetical protein